MSTEPRAGAWLPGEVVRDHVLMQRLGKGGMGEVWRARHIPTGASRALKVLPVVEDMETLIRFQREGEALARVDGHPNLVRVHTSGVHGGRPWLAMELIEGGDLTTRLQHGVLPPREAALLVRDVARGVAHAHARGVIHRDIKPSNVLLGEDGAPRLTDFGLARIAGEKSLTATGTILGTPSHMAPEQARGERADEQSDVYGLGALLHHALTGLPPVRGEKPVDVVLNVMEGRLDPPPPDLPAGLAEIRRRALAHAPSARWPGAAAMADALDAWLRGEAPQRSGLAWAVRGGLLALGLLSAGLLALAALEPAPRPATPPDEAPGPAPASEPAPPASGTASTPERRSWAERYRDPGGPGREERPDPYLEAAVNSEASNLATLWKRGERVPWQRLDELVAARSAVAQQMLGEILVARGGAERERGMGLLWRASRSPTPDRWAGVHLAQALLAEGDREGARWVLAEDAARYTNAETRGDSRRDSALVSLRLGEPADVARALRLVRAHTSGLRGGDQGIAWLRVALGPDGPEASAELRRLSEVDPSLAAATSVWLGAARPSPEMLDPADVWFQEHPPEPFVEKALGGE